MQRPFGGDRRIELAQRARGGVAWIGEDLVALLRLTFVQSRKGLVRHVHLAAHFEHLGRIVAKRLRHVADGADIGGDVLTIGAVAARRAERELAVLVTQRS